MKHLFVLGLLGASAMSLGQAFFDDFNRADDVSLGGSYDVIGSGSATRVLNNEAGNISQENNLSLVKSSVFTGAYDGFLVSADVRLTDTTTNLTYIALALGQDGTEVSGHGLFIKVQRQSGLGGFSHFGIYTAVGTSNGTAVTGGSPFGTLNSEFSSGRMTIWCSDPTTINLGIDTDFNGSFEQLYTRTLDFGGGFVAGNRVGLAVYGSVARADNFSVNPVPEPASLGILVAALAGLASRRRRR